MAKIEELENAIAGLGAVVPSIAEDYKSLIGLVADLQAKLEALAKPDAALQQRISDLTTKANSTLAALKGLDAQYPAVPPAA